MTTEGGVSLRDIMAMDDKERTWWYDRCVEHSEQVEDKTRNIRRP